MEKKYGIVYPNVFGVVILEYDTLEEAKKEAGRICSDIARQIDVGEHHAKKNSFCFR